MQTCKKTLCCWLQLLSALCFCGCVAASDPLCPGDENSYLWKVSTSPPVYLFGTMHVPYSTLWPTLPENVKVAFAASEELCLELELLDRDTQNKLSHCRLISGDGTLADVLSSESQDLVGRVSRYMDKIQEILPRWMYGPSGRSSLFNSVSNQELFQKVVGNWQKLRPIWLLFLIGSLTEESIQHRREPVFDTFLERAAQGMGKGVQAVEHPEEQCKPFNKLSQAKVELALRVQLDYLESLTASEDFNGPESSLNKDVESYRCGDFTHLVNHTPMLPIPSMDNITATSPNLTASDLSMLREVESSLHRQLVVKRNRKMAQRIEELLHQNRTSTYFLGLGAGHFKTDRLSVIDRLRRKGFEVEHIQASQAIDGPALPDNIVALGDPNSAPRLLRFDKTDAPPPTQPPSSTLSREEIHKIFNEVFKLTNTTTSSSRQTRSANMPLSQTLPVSDAESWREWASQMLTEDSQELAPPLAEHNSASSTTTTHFRFSQLLTLALIIGTLVSSWTL